MKKTYIVMINPSSELSPDQLFNEILSLDINVIVKCTCFGVMVEGEESEVLKALDYVRKKYPYDVFIKLRGYPINDRRVCRAYRGGGPRPGFHQLDAEYRLLPFIADALRSLDMEIEEERKPKPEDKPIKVEELKSVIREVLGNECSS
ncbi:MAG: methanogenesis marker 6 protein [Candidatus Nezhaarchaeales archaeon]